MTRITAAPEWEWWLVWYFFIGGLAAGLYFVTALIELVGTAPDRKMAKASYYLAFPLSLLCAVPAILILASPWIRDCYWRPTSLKVGLPLATRRPR
jgi:protein NrfD